MDPVEDLFLTRLDDSFCSGVSFKKAVELAYSVHTKEILLDGFSTCNICIFTATILTFSFTDPVEELLLTELDNAFTSRVSFRAVAELVYSVQSVSVASPHAGI